MSNQVDSIWTRTPGLHASVQAAIDAGRAGRAIERAIFEAHGVTVSANAAWKHLAKCRGACQVSAESLTVPAGGYAKPVTAPPQYSHPKGWEPRVEETGNSATAVSVPTTNANPDDEWLIREWGLNPAHWRIVPPLSVNRWPTQVPIRNRAACQCSEKLDEEHYEPRWNYQYKARLDRIDPVRESETAALIEEIRTHLPIPFAPPRGDDALVIAIADPQMGKGDVGGSEHAIRNFLRSVDAFEARVPTLRAQGKARGALYVLGMGDLIENCDGFYPQQTFRADLNLRDQVKVMRRLIVKALERWAPLFEKVVVPCVGGNHGESRKDGKSFTDFADNHDVAIFEQVQEILAANSSAYGHVSFLIPKDELSLTMDMGGEIVGLTHGQVFGKGSAAQPAKRAIDWWSKQAHGRQPIGDARILFSAHYHHLLVTQTGTKTHFQCPALESGSDWYRNQTGQAAPPGMLTVLIGKNVSPSGWSDLEVV